MLVSGARDIIECSVWVSVVGCSTSTARSRSSRSSTWCVWWCASGVPSRRYPVCDPGGKSGRHQLLHCQNYHLLPPQPPQVLPVRPRSQPQDQARRCLQAARGGAAGALLGKLSGTVVPLFRLSFYPQPLLSPSASATGLLNWVKGRQP